MQQQIIAQITQGKIQTALENLIQYSNQLKDKELNQQSLLLFSQLSQLNKNFSTGQIDNKIYQSEMNRITEATLQAANTLPASKTFQQPYSIEYQPGSGQQQDNEPQRPSRQRSNDSFWKTWGIMLTGAVGLLLILVVVGLMMDKEPAATDANALTSTSEQAQGEQTQQGSNVVQNNVAEDNTVSEFDESFFVGAWVGSMVLNGVTMNYTLQLSENNEYASAIVETMNGERSDDHGTWSISPEGKLTLNSEADQGHTTSRVVWDNDDQFTTTIIDGSTPEANGMKMTFVRAQ